MKKTIIAVLLLSSLPFFTSCSNSRVGGGIYHHYHGHGPWLGSGYYRDRVIVVPPTDVAPAFEATPLPSGPEMMPDMGMPDMGGDMGGDDF